MTVAGISSCIGKTRKQVLVFKLIMILRIRGRETRIPAKQESASPTQTLTKDITPCWYQVGISVPML